MGIAKVVASSLLILIFLPNLFVSGFENGEFHPTVMQSFKEFSCKRTFNFNSTPTHVSGFANPTLSKIIDLQNACKFQSFHNSCVIFNFTTLSKSIKWIFSSIVNCIEKGTLSSKEDNFLYQGVDLQIVNPTPTQKKYVRITQPNLKPEEMNQMQSMNLRDFHSLERSSIFLPIGKTTLEFLNSMNKSGIITAYDPLMAEVKDVILPGLHQFIATSFLKKLDRGSIFNKSNYYVRTSGLPTE